MKGCAPLEWPTAPTSSPASTRRRGPTSRSFSRNGRASGWSALRSGGGGPSGRSPPPRTRHADLYDTHLARASSRGADPARGRARASHHRRDRTAAQGDDAGPRQRNGRTPATEVAALARGDAKRWLAIAHDLRGVLPGEWSLRGSRGFPALSGSRSSGRFSGSPTATRRCTFSGGTRMRCSPGWKLTTPGPDRRRPPLSGHRLECRRGRRLLARRRWEPHPRGVPRAGSGCPPAAPARCRWSSR